MDENPTTTPPRRRRLVIPALVASLALGVAGAGIGYAAGQHSTSAAAAPGTASTRTTQPSFNTPGDQRYFIDPNGTTTSPFGDGSADGGGSQSDSTDTTGQASGDQLTGLVRIATTNKYDGAQAAGTGMVLTSNGEVVTNHHVVAGATSVRVKIMSSGTTYTAKVVGTDAKDDVAVLQLVGASGLDTVTTDNDGVTTGDAVTAVGDGDGTTGYLSAASGSVLATDQAITTSSEGAAAGERLTDLLEISSDVVAGYSGGATYDDDGQVVGMTTAASSGTSDIVGYAIPIAKVLTIADDLESGKHGASYTYDLPAFLGIGLGNGTTVQGVYDGTPAAQAGIAPGDQITAVSGVRTTTTTQLRSAIASHSPGERVSITWTDTSGAGHTATLTLAAGPVE